MGLTESVSKLIDGLHGHDFVSADMVRALPGFTPAAIRGHLHWLVTNGTLITHKERNVSCLIYCAPREIEAQGAHFVCSLALIEAMRRLSDHHRAPPVPVSKTEDDLAWMQRLLERCRVRC